MPDLISTVPGDIGSGGPTLPTADPAPQPGPDTGAPAPGPGPDTPPPGDKGGSDPGKSGAPALDTDTPSAPKPDATPAPAAPAESPEVQGLRGKIDALTQLVGQLMPTKPDTPAAPPRDFAGEKAALDADFKAEKIDATTYSTKVGELAMAQAEAKASALINQGNQNTVEQVQAELKKAQDATSWKALCDANPGLSGFERSPEFAALKAQNPLHDPLSAYLTHQLAEAKAATEKAVTDAVAAKEKEMVEAIRAKGHAAVLGNPGGQAPQGGPDFAAMLKEPEKYGGMAAVQAAKLKHMRASAGR
ncbi:hypothetical protein [Solidesulfovibrio sp. C21]|uniref:hypothetical protein n=1 Tax=Solidesulfovibrio sp. C21 TaxID=3398613 RepID=UPI0039FD317C